MRGRRCTSLYRIGWSDALLDRDVSELRRELGVDQEHAVTWGDRVAFAALVGAIALPPVLAIVALALLVRS